MMGVGMMEVGQIAEDLPIPVLVFDSETQRLGWLNVSGQFWLGSSLKSLAGKSLGELFHGADELLAIYDRTKTNMSPVQGKDIILKPRSRDEVRCQVSSFLHDDHVGLCFLLQGRQKYSENVFDDGASALGRLLAHEIKNPLAGIRGAAQLLRDDVESEEARSLLGLIETEIGRIKRLAERMERLGDAPPSEFSQINIHETLRHVRKVIQSGISPDVSFVENYDPSLPMALGDEDSLTQAILNLVKNAVEALGEAAEAPEIRLETSFRANSSGLPIEIRIIDNGAGIPLHVRDKIFQPFITHKPAGQGLGLALVSKVVAAHKGVIEVQSRPGETIFSILLPVKKGITDEV